MNTGPHQLYDITVIGAKHYHTGFVTAIACSNKRLIPAMCIVGEWAVRQLISRQLSELREIGRSLIDEV